MYIAAGVFSVSPVPDFHSIRKGCDTCKNYRVVSLGFYPLVTSFCSPSLFHCSESGLVRAYQGAVERALFVSDVLVMILVVIGFIHDLF